MLIIGYIKLEKEAAVFRLIEDLSKAVSSYIYCRFILNFDITGEVIISIEILTYLDVLCTFIVLRVSSEVNSRAVILVDKEGS